MENLDSLEDPPLKGNFEAKSSTLCLMDVQKLVNT